ncbi:MAG: DMT family transporter [Hylemonella sp.]|uniref:DMT family transporter n=1 Tax=Hylemonella sp. TaxID=2066020 RepID=UPI0022C5895C|nr:DMT family transporter [Hylemonella sp.]MCZ8252608.1 DMT family transporter [Hylemonella sp.]
MDTATRHRLALTLLFITPALWSVNALIARKAPGVIEPHLLAMLRWLMASGLFFLGAHAEIWAQLRQILTDSKHYLTLGALGMWICGAWVYIGGHTTSAANIGLIYAISPVLIVLASALWLREPFSLRQALGVGLALAGVLHVVLKGQWDALAAVQFVPGDGWILAATLSWTLYSLLLKKWQSPLSLGAQLALISLAGALINLPFALWEIFSTPRPALTAEGGMLALTAAVIPGFGAYLAHSFMQRELGAARVSVVLYLSPIYTALMAWVVLGEGLSTYHLWGMALVLPGIYLVTRAGPR